MSTNITIFKFLEYHVSESAMLMTTKSLIWSGLDQD